MRVLVFDAHSYDREFLDRANAGRHELEYTTAQLSAQTAPLAQGFQAVCLFVNDKADAVAVARLAEAGVRAIAQRSTGFNNIDLVAAERHGLTCMRVASYSPYSVAEFAVGLLLALNRRIHRAYNRTREFNFRLAGLLGHDLHGKKVGVIGTGKIGAVFCRIMVGFGCPVLAYDVRENPECLAMGVSYAPLDDVLAESDVISLHVPLTPETHHLIDADRLARMKKGAIVINTSRGGLIDTGALIGALRDGHLAAVGLDVYEEEESKFFRDLSDRVIDDEVLALLMTFPNVLLTSHQAFFTHEAMTTIAETTILNLTDFEEGRESPNRLRPA
jgi:D-lactate dehydrogenase